MGYFSSMQINTSGLNLERLKLDVISSNITNANTTRTPEGGPYLKKEVTFEESIKRQQSYFTGQPAQNQSFGVRSTGIIENDANIKMVYEPDHPDANEDGYVAYPNVDMADEMIDLMTTMRAYDANVTAMNASKAMLNKALQIANN